MRSLRGRRAMLCVAAAVGLSACPVLANNTWVHPAAPDNTWENPSNWNIGRLPSEGMHDAAHIDQGFHLISTAADNSADELFVGADHDQYGRANPGGKGTLDVLSGVLTVTILGAGANYINPSDDSGTINISGGIVNAGRAFIGLDRLNPLSTTTGTLNLSGSGVLNIVDDTIGIGTGGGSGHVNISGDAQLNLGIEVVNYWTVGDGGGSGTISQSGGTVTWNSIAPVGLVVGSTGTAAGSALYEMSGGTLNMNGALIFVGRALSGATMAGTVLQSGGIIRAGQVALGVSADGSTASGQWVMTGGTLSAHELALGHSGGAGGGTFTLVGGTIELTNGGVVRGGQTSGVLNINGPAADHAIVSATPGAYQVGTSKSPLSQVGIGVNTAGGFVLGTDMILRANTIAAGQGPGGAGTLTIDGGTAFPGALLVGADSDASGLVHHLGGTVQVSSKMATGLLLGGAAAASGTYNLGGGLLDTPLIALGGGTGAFNFTGGRLRLGRYDSSLGSLVQTGPSSELFVEDHDTAIDVGYELRQGQATVLLYHTLSTPWMTVGDATHAAVAEVGGNLSASTLSIGNGVVHQTDGTVTLNPASTTPLVLGGVAGGIGTYSLAGGRLITPRIMAATGEGAGVFSFTGGNLRVGSFDPALGALVQAGSTSVLSVQQQDTTLPDYNLLQGSAIIDAGRTLTCGAITLGDATRSGSMSISGTVQATSMTIVDGTVNINAAGTLDLNPSGIGLVLGTTDGRKTMFNLNGGLVTTPRISRTGGSLAFYFGNGTLKVGQVEAGIPELSQNGAASVLSVEDGDTSVANTYRLLGGQAIVAPGRQLSAGHIVIGNASGGGLLQSAGNVTTSDLSVRNGSMHIEGGTVQATSTYMEGSTAADGSAIAGTIDLSGGTITTGVARMAIASGTLSTGAAWNVSGGVLNASELNVGYSGLGTAVFSQSGGEVNIDPLSTRGLRLAAAATVSGAYNLSGGILRTPKIASGGGPAAFNFTGGTLAVGQYDASMGTLTQSGASSRLSVADGNTTIGGDYQLIEGQAAVSAGRALAASHIFVGDATHAGTLDAQGTLTASSLVVQGGTATLNGTVDVPLIQISGGTLNTAVNLGPTMRLQATAGELRLLTSQYLVNPQISPDAKVILAQAGVQLNVIESLGGGQGGGSTTFDLWTLVCNGYNGPSGAWTGTGITSTAIADPNLNGLGLVLSDPTVLPQTLTVREMILGDVNGDDKVTIGDVMIALNSDNYQQDGTWLNGDVNYDGKVTIGDVMLMLNSTRYQQDYNPANAPAQIAALEAAGLGSLASAAVPEPATLGLLAVGAMGLLARRRRA